MSLSQYIALAFMCGIAAGIWFGRMIAVSSRDVWRARCRQAEIDRDRYKESGELERLWTL
jgi:hypothetical protein